MRISYEKFMEDFFDINEAYTPFETGINTLYNKESETIDEEKLAYGHLWSEFCNKRPSWRKREIREEHGYISGLQNALLGIDRKVFYACKELNNPGDITRFVITEQDFPNVKNKFFDILRCTVTIIKSDTRASECFYDERKSGKVGNQTILTLELTVYGSSYEDIISSIKSDLSHELIHAYQDITMRNDNQGGVYTAHNDINYEGAIDLLRSTNKNDNRLGYFLYYLHRTEQNAYIGQAYAELEAKTDSLIDGEHTMEVIKNTEYARLLRQAEKILDSITNEVNPNIKKQYLESFQKVSGITTTNYNKMIRYLRYILTRAQSHYYKQVSKMAYEIYAKNAPRLQAKPHQKKKNNK